MTATHPAAPLAPPSAADAPTARGRAARTALVVLATAGAAWALWPRPALELVVDAAGVGHVAGRFGLRALPETLVVDGGRHAEVRLVNRSARRQSLGIFDVGPGETRSYRVGAPGTFGGYCSAHPTSKRLVYVIR